MIVVADTSVVINLCCVGQGDLLRRLFRDVVVPPAVAVEFARLAANVPRFADAVLLDERRGREVAGQLGLRTIGILGLLLQAKSAGLLPAVRPVLDDLQREAGFWITEPLRQQLLSLAGE